MLASPSRSLYTDYNTILLEKKMDKKTTGNVATPPPSPPPRPEKMDKKTTGIIATVASVLLCGCPGVLLCILGIGTALGAGTYTLGDQVGYMPPTYGYVFLCLSLILIAIPIVVGTLMLRKKPGASTSPDEPLPPVA